MSFQINGLTTGIFSNDVSCNNLDVLNIINNSLNQTLFFNNFSIPNFTSSNGYILVGQVQKTTNSNTNYLQLTTNANYGLGYCELYLCGTHFNNAGFSIKYEFNITNNPTTNVITQGTTVRASGTGTTFSGTTFGSFGGAQPTISQTTVARVTQISVNCAVTSNVGYVLLYRIMSRFLSVQNL